jgi:hypothetical protein
MKESSTIILDNNFVFQVREDFSLLVAPKSLSELNNGVYREDIDRSHDAEKGFIISSRAKRKIRSAVYSLYCRATREEQLNLRFVTFTFPPLPQILLNSDVKAQDAFLHNLFKKFIDNERKEGFRGRDGKAVRLEKYLWVNERQDGSRLKGIVDARNVLHYHCLFRYSSNVDYWTCNVRWLNLLHRNGFQIFNQAFLAGASYKERRLKVIELLENLDYKSLYDMRDQLKIEVWRISKGFQTESIFLQPVDFDKSQIQDVQSLGKYLSAYITKDHEAAADERQKELLKIYARRWGCSRGLVIPKEIIQEQFNQAFPQEIINEETGGQSLTIVDEDTGEIIDIFPGILTAMHKESVLKLYRLDHKAYASKFEIEVQGNKFECYYFPPRFELWAQMPEIKQFFKKAFGYNIV